MLNLNASIHMTDNLVSALNRLQVCNLSRQHCTARKVSPGGVEGYLERRGKWCYRSAHRQANHIECCSWPFECNVPTQPVTQPNESQRNLPMRPKCEVFSTPFRPDQPARSLLSTEPKPNQCLLRKLCLDSYR